MCHYITATLPAGVDPQVIAPIFQRHQRKLEALGNSIVLGQLPRGEQYFLTTGKFCDCGTALGSQLRRTVEHSPEDEIPKLKRKGWSAAKIDRWLNDKRSARERQQLAREEQAQLDTPDAESWQALLQEVLDTTSTQHVGLLLHWYHGSVEEERITIQEIVRVPIDKATPEFLMQIAENVVYCFTR